MTDCMRRWPPTQHMQELLDRLPTDSHLAVSYVAGDGVERAVWDNGCYYEAFRYAVPSEAPTGAPTWISETVGDAEAWPDAVCERYTEACLDLAELRRSLGPEPNVDGSVPKPMVQRWLVTTERHDKGWEFGYSTWIVDAVDARAACMEYIAVREASFKDVLQSADPWDDEGRPSVFGAVPMVPLGSGFASFSGPDRKHQAEAFDSLWAWDRIETVTLGGD